MTSWLTYIIIAVIILSVFFGWRNGFVRTLMAMVSWILVILLAGWMNPYVSGFLRKNTSVETYLTDKCTAFLEDHFESGDSPGAEEQNNWIESLTVPESLKNALKENNNEQAYQTLGVSGFSDYVGKYLAHGITNGIAFLLAVFLAALLVRQIGHALNLLAWLPGIGFLNHLGGAIFGVARGVLWMWLFFILITVFADTSWGSACMREVGRDTLLNYLYSHNYLMNIILNIVGM